MAKEREALKAELGPTSKPPAIVKLAGEKWRRMSANLQAPFEAPPCVFLLALARFRLVLWFCPLSETSGDMSIKGAPVERVQSHLAHQDCTQQFGVLWEKYVFVFA